MRRILSIICALILTLLIPLAWMVSRGLPADTGSYIAEKYAGWSGVLQAWVCCEWQPGGSFISWLNRCALEFENDHEGVYIEFMPVDRDALALLSDGSIRRPELVFFSPGVPTDTSLLKQIETPGQLREELRHMSPALPVAIGGTIWVVNRELAGSMIPSDVIIPAGFDEEAAALMSGDVQEEITPMQPGLDLGLPAAAALPMNELLERFMDGELSCLPVTQAEIARLARLRDSGRGPDWECIAAGSYAYSDQLLLAGITSGEGERFDLAQKFALSLLGDDKQAALADIGAFSVTGQMIHNNHSPYAQLDALLNSRPLAVPPVFPEHSNPNDPAPIFRQQNDKG